MADAMPCARDRLVGWKIDVKTKENQTHAYPDADTSPMERLERKINEWKAKAQIAKEEYQRKYQRYRYDPQRTVDILKDCGTQKPSSPGRYAGCARMPLWPTACAHQMTRTRSCH